MEMVNKVVENNDVMIFFKSQFEIYLLNILATVGNQHQELNSCHATWRAEEVDIPEFSSRFRLPTEAEMLSK